MTPEEENQPPKTIPEIAALKSILQSLTEKIRYRGHNDQEQAIWHMLIYLQEVEQRLVALENQWKEDHETLYLLVHQRIDELQDKLKGEGEV